MAETNDKKLELVRKALRYCPDFPKKGITFVDIFGLFTNPEAHRALIDVILTHIKTFNTKIDAVVGLEARGFVFGPQVALELKIPFVPIRKRGKLPGKVVKLDYDLEYGKDTIEMQVDALKTGSKILLVDDLLATGGTLGAAEKLCVNIGCEVVEALVIIELTDLNGRSKLSDSIHVSSLLRFTDADLEVQAAN